MTKDQIEQVERGKRLWLLKDHYLYADLKAHIAETIADLEGERDRWDARTAAGSIMLAGYHHELKALKGLQVWMQDEIDAGAEILKKNQEQEPVKT